jgi:outer membrane protein assembly factor BamB
VADRLGAWILTSRAVERLRMRPVRVKWRRPLAREPQALATDGRSVWVSTFAAASRPAGALYRFNAQTGRLESVRPMSLVLTMLAARRGVLWGVGSGGGPVVRIDRDGAHRVAGVVRPSAVAATPAAIWVAGGDGSLYRVREDGTVAARRKVASSATLLAAAGGTVWIFDAAAGRLVAVDTRDLSQ